MLGYSGNSSLFCPGNTARKTTHPQFLPSSEDKYLLGRDQTQRGVGGCETLVEPGKGRQQLVLEKRQKNSDLGVLAGQQGQPPADSVELEHKCFQISVARKQMTC